MSLSKLKRNRTQSTSQCSKIITRSSTIERLREKFLNTIASGSFEEDNIIVKVFRRHGLDKCDRRTISIVSEYFQKEGLFL